MELSKTAAAQLIYDIEFHNWAKEEGLRDPFEVHRKLFKKRCKKDEDTGAYHYDMSYIDPEEPSDEEKRVFKLIEYMFIIDKIFAELGYEEALERVELWNEEVIRQYFEMKKPCEAAERQCDMRCKYFLECEEK